MPDQKTVHVVGGFKSYEEMFEWHNWMCVDNVEDADLVQFCGGEDVWPGFYGEKPHKSTHFNPERDKYERKVYELAVCRDKAIAGICRGAQFVHVMNGGRLFQDVDKHALFCTHQATIIRVDLLDGYGFDGNIAVTSTHHQQIHDNIGEVVLAAWLSTAKHSEHGLVDDGNAYAWDVEAIWHPTTRSFCYQPHPEYCTPAHDCQKFYFQALRKLLFYNDKAEMKEAS